MLVGLTFLVANTVRRRCVRRSSLLNGAELVDFWLNDASDYWFSSTPSFDRIVKEKWGDALSASLRDEPPPIDAHREVLFAHVVLWDQVARHCARLDDISVVEEANRRALPLSRALLDRIDDWPTVKQSFALMPLRHTFEPDALEECLEYAERWKRREGADAAAWRRFENAALRALLRVNTQRLEQASSSNTDWRAYTNVIEPDSTCEDVEEAWQSRFEKGTASLAAYKKIRLFLRNNPGKHFVVSVSGGVDSMLLLFLLCRLGGSVTAAHVDYRNRPESCVEADFVQAYCAWLKVPLFRRDLVEIRRNSATDREDYERLTRETRFELYRRASGGDDETYALLGHNRNDCWENLFTNIEKGQHYDELRGMKEEASEFGINTLRPMLSLTKAEIYEAARAFGVPHTKDSTNADCERGILRDRWLPLVEENRPALIPGLERLSDHVAFLNGMWRMRIEQFISEEATFCGPGDVSIPVRQWILEAPSEMLWVDLFENLFRRVKERPSRPSNKSFQNMHDWLARRSAEAGASDSLCHLSRDYLVTFNPRHSPPSLRIQLVSHRTTRVDDE